MAATRLSSNDEFSTDAPQPVCPQYGSLLVRPDPDAPMVQLTDVGSDNGATEWGALRPVEAVSGGA